MQADSPLAVKRYPRTHADANYWLCQSTGESGEPRAPHECFSRIRQHGCATLSRTSTAEPRGGYRQPLGLATAPLGRVVELTKAGLRGDNRKICQYAAGILPEHFDVPAGRKKKEPLPLIFPLLLDRSKRVRLQMIWLLSDWVEDVPVEVAARAMLEENDPPLREGKEELLRRVLDARTGAE